MANNEKIQGNTGERNEKANHELEQAASERREQLRQNLEQAGEKGHEKSLESATTEALEHAKSAEKKQENQVEKRHNKSPVERRKDGPISRSERNASFKKTMKQVQDELPAPSRTFSKFIHNKIVEKTSDAVGNTVARPNAILSGSVCAFIFTLGIFLIARQQGYPLSGSETIAAFVVGWAVGLLLDYLRLEITGKKF